MITLYHNPRCSKSREALELLKSKGLEVQTIDYLKHPPTVNELDDILQKLKMQPQEIIRTKEEAYKNLGLKNKTHTRLELLQILTQNPILIERPIAINGSQAILGRPPERVLEII